MHATKVPAHWHHDTSWSDIPEETLPSGVRMRSYRIGMPGDEGAPTVFRVTFPPGMVVPVHTHACDYSEIIESGAQRVGRTWFRPGDIRVVKAGTYYGPIEVGDEGATVMLIFRDGQYTPVPLEAHKESHSVDG